jgi:hypothetical protein
MAAEFALQCFFTDFGTAIRTFHDFVPLSHFSFDKFLILASLAIVQNFLSLTHHPLPIGAKK